MVHGWRKTASPWGTPHPGGSLQILPDWSRKGCDGPVPSSPLGTTLESHSLRSLWGNCVSAQPVLLPIPTPQLCIFILKHSPINFPFADLHLSLLRNPTRNTYPYLLPTWLVSLWICWYNQSTLLLKHIKLKSNTSECKILSKETVTIHNLFLSLRCSVRKKAVNAGASRNYVRKGAMLLHTVHLILIKPS